jgi:photosynthetic reaction center cytochrome c subunit
VTAWYGIQMVRELNNAYMKPLTEVFPAHRLGPTGDVAKSNCTTCHQGAYKPMYGKAMAKDYPAMYGAPSPGMAASAPELVAQDAAAPAVEVAAK